MSRLNSQFSKTPNLCIVGLGYVGLPLAVEFAKYYTTIGYDIDPTRIAELRKGCDKTLEVEAEILSQSNLKFTSDISEIANADVYVVTVPTPIDRHKQPDLGPLEAASQLIGTVINPGNVVIYESTVYPGATEEVCAPIIENVSGLRLNRDFFVGYSPERINPGDKQHRVTDIVKVTAGSTEETAEFVDSLYRTVVKVGTHKAASIKIAEAAKVIENTQRDLNIALVNELSIVFNRMGIDTLEVLQAAGTKWNFLPFRPGLVGGHCIGVDPYYLTHKSQELGYSPEVILAGRRINDSMGAYVVAQVVKLMLKRRIHVNQSKILVLGLTFKENCPDIRNTRVVDIVREFQDYGASVDVSDPWINVEDAVHEYAIQPIREPLPGTYDAIVVAVGHDYFKQLGAEVIRGFGNANCVLFDVKSILPKHSVDGRL